MLIHTDEPAVSAEVVDRALLGHMFDIPSNDGRVYLLLSYAPGAGYPYFRLRGVAEDGGAAGPA